MTHVTRLPSPYPWLPLAPHLINPGPPSSRALLRLGSIANAENAVPGRIVHEIIDFLSWGDWSYARKTESLFVL